MLAFVAVVGWIKVVLKGDDSIAGSSMLLVGMASLGVANGRLVGLPVVSRVEMMTWQK
jgi:hypothetical protein